VAIQPLTFRITANLDGFNAGLSQVMGRLRGAADQVRGAFYQSTTAIGSSMSSAAGGVA
jgi:hypothetical protein